jgi:hypothetical protein
LSVFISPYANVIVFSAFLVDNSSLKPYHTIVKILNYFTNYLGVEMMNQELNNNSRMDEVIPLEFHLSQNYPNPFKDKTVIKYCVGYKTRVKLTILDAEGEVIETLVDEEKKPGTYEVEFSACHSRESLPARLVSDESERDGKAGGNLIEGEFFYRLEAGDYSSEKKMILENESSHTH